MLDKIKSMPRLTAACISIIMLFFPFVSTGMNVSGLSCIRMNGLSVLFILVPIFVVLVDVNVIKLKNNLEICICLAREPG